MPKEPNTTKKTKATTAAPKQPQTAVAPKEPKLAKIAPTRLKFAGKRQKGGVFVGPLPENTEYTKDQIEAEFLKNKKRDEDGVLSDDILGDVDETDPNSFVTFARGKAVGILTKNNLKSILERTISPTDPISRQNFDAAVINWALDTREKTPNRVHPIKLNGHTSVVTCVVFSPDGLTIATGSNDKTVRLWRASDGRLLRTLRGHTNWVNSVTFSPDGTLLATGADDKTVLLWRVPDVLVSRNSLASGLVRTLTGAGVILSLAFSPDGTTLATGSEAEIQLWHVADGRLLRALTVKRMSWANSVAFSPDGITLAAGLFDGTVRLWRASNGRLLHTLTGHMDGVNSIAFSPNGETLASCSEDKTIRLWRVADGGALHTLTGHRFRIKSAAFSPDGAMLISCSPDEPPRLWRVSNGAVLYAPVGHIGVNGAAFSPDGKVLATIEGDGTTLTPISEA